MGGHGSLGVNLAHGNASLFTQCAPGSTAGTATNCTGVTGLAGTGLNIPHAGTCDANSLVGGDTDWRVLRGSVVPGETIVLRLAIWDTSDGAYDSVLLLDNFRWSPMTVTPGMSRN